MTYKNRTGKDAPPSGGTGLSRPIGGAGKLLPGKYQGEIIAISFEPFRALLLIAEKATGEIHSDYYVSLPRDLVTGLPVEFVIDYGPGYIVAKNGGQYQAVGTESGLPVGPWHSSLEDLYRDTEGKPASTELKELTYDGGKTVQPKIYTPPTGVPKA